ncbi:MAG: DinB family protein [Pyrinomonadaceae bacterium]|nr:DinB family protein [Pyrinomonadaceae bacterium]
MVEPSENYLVKNNFDLSKNIEILSQTPQTVNSLLSNLSHDWIYAKTEENSWNAFDIVGHYIHAEQTDWITRAKIILAQGENTTFEPFDRFAQLELSKGKTLKELLETFAKMRQKNLEILQSWNLTENQLKLKGIHPELGEVTLEQLLATWADHDLTHIRQLVTILAKQYTDNVGVWKQYLSILN